MINDTLEHTNTTFKQKDTISQPFLHSPIYRSHPAHPLLPPAPGLQSQMGPPRRLNGVPVFWLPASPSSKPPVTIKEDRINPHKLFWLQMSEHKQSRGYFSQGNSRVYTELKPDPKTTAAYGRARRQMAGIRQGCTYTIVSSDQYTLTDVDACSSETLPGVCTNTFQIDKTLVTLPEWGRNVFPLPRHKEFRQHFKTTQYKTVQFWSCIFVFIWNLNCLFLEAKNHRTHSRHGIGFWSPFSWWSHVTLRLLYKPVKVQELRAGIILHEELLYKALTTHSWQE